MRTKYWTPYKETSNVSLSLALANQVATELKFNPTTHKLLLFSTKLNSDQYPDPLKWKNCSKINLNLQFNNRNTFPVENEHEIKIVRSSNQFSINFSLRSSIMNYVISGTDQERGEKRSWNLPSNFASTTPHFGHSCWKVYDFFFFFFFGGGRKAWVRQGESLLVRNCVIVFNKIIGVRSGSGCRRLLSASTSVSLGWWTITKAAADNKTTLTDTMPGSEMYSLPFCTEVQINEAEWSSVELTRSAAVRENNKGAYQRQSHTCEQPCWFATRCSTGHKGGCHVRSQGVAVFCQLPRQGVCKLSIGVLKGGPSPHLRQQQRWTADKPLSLAAGCAA